MIRNLLFDLGGVIMDICRQNCIDAFSALGMPEPGRYLGEYVQAGPFGQLESGLISPEEFRRQLRADLPAGVTDAQIDEAFGRFLTGIPVARLHALEQLRQRYKVYMLSNTNPIMWHDGIDRYFRTDGHDMSRYFDGTLTSFEARVMKPDAAIFRLACEKFDIDPTETLFIDDSAANTEAASKLGFATLTVPPGAEFSELITRALQQ